MSDNNNLGLSIEFGNQEQFAGTLSDLERLLNSIERRIGTTVDLFSLLEGRIRALSGAFSGSTGAKSFVSTLNDINNSLKSGNFEKTADRLTALVTPAKAASKAVKDIATALDTGGIQVAGSNFTTTLNSIVTTLNAANLPVVARQLTGAAANLPAVLSAVKKVSKALSEFTTLNIDALPTALEKIFKALQISGNADIQAETTNLTRSLNDLSVTMKFFFDRVKTISDGLDTKVADKITKVADALKNIRRLSFDKAVEGIKIGAQQLAEAIYQLNFVNFSTLETKAFQIRQFINGLAEIKLTGFLRTINALDKGFQGFNHFLEGLQSLPGRTVEVENTLTEFVNNIKNIDLTDFSKTFKTAGLEDIASKLRNFSSTVQASATKLDTLKGNFSALGDTLKLAGGLDATAAIDVMQRLNVSLNSITGQKQSPVFVSIIADLAKGLKILKDISVPDTERIGTTILSLVSIFNQVQTTAQLPRGKDPFPLLASRIKSLGEIAKALQQISSVGTLDIPALETNIQSLIRIANVASTAFTFSGVGQNALGGVFSVLSKIPLLGKLFSGTDIDSVAQRALSLQRLVVTLQRISSLPNVDLTTVRLAVRDLVSILGEVQKTIVGNPLEAFGTRLREGFVNLISGGSAIGKTLESLKALSEGISALKGLQKIDVKSVQDPLRALVTSLSSLSGFFKRNQKDLETSAAGFAILGTAIQTFGTGISAAVNSTARFEAAIRGIGTELPTLTKGLAQGLKNGKLAEQFGAEGKAAADSMLKNIQETWEIRSPSRAMVRIGNQLFDGLKVAAISYPFAQIATTVVAGFTNPLAAGLVAGVIGLTPILLGAFSRLASSLSGKLKEVGARLRQEGKNLAQEGFQELASGGILAFLQKQQVSIAADFDQTLNQIRIFGSLTGDTLKKVENDLLHFSAVTIFNPQQTADAFLSLQKAGLTTSQALESLNSVGALATAGQLDLAKASNLTVTAMTLFGLKTQDSGRIADIFVQVANKSVASVDDLAQGLGNVGAIANQFGLSLEQTVAILGIFNDNGIKGAEAGTQLKSVLAGITKPTAEVKKVFSELNVKLVDAKGNFRNFNDILSDLSVAMEGTRKVTTQVSGITADQAAHLELLKKAYASATKQIQAYQIAAETGAVPQKKAAAELAKYQQIQANSQRLINEITKNAGTGAKITSEITRSQAQNFAAIQALAGSFGGSGLAVLIGAGDDALNQYIADFQKLPGATQLADENMKSFKGTLESFKGSVETLIIKALRPLLNDVVAPLLQMAIDLVNRLADLPEPVLKFAAGISIAVASVASISGVLKIFSGSLKTIAGTFLQIAGSATETAATIAAPGAGLLSSIVSLVGAFAAAIPIIAAFGAALYVGYNIFIGLKNDFDSNTGGLRDAVVGLFGSVRDSFLSVVSIIQNGVGIIGTLLGDIGLQIQTAFNSQIIRDAIRTAQNLFSGIAQTLDTIAKTIAFVKQGLEAISAIPAPAAAAVPAAPAAPVQGTGDLKVQAGDTYTSIAKRTGTTVEALKKENNNTRLLAGITVLKVPMQIVPPEPAKLAATVKDLTVSAADAALIDEGKVNLGLARRIGVQLSTQIDPLEQLFRRISTTDFFKSIFGETDLTGALNVLKGFRATINGIGDGVANLVKTFSEGGLLAVVSKLAGFIANLIPTNFEIDLGGIRDVFIGLVQGFERITGIGSGVSNFFKNLLKGLGVLKVDLRPIAKGIGDFFNQIRQFDVGKFVGDVFTGIRNALGRLGNTLKRFANDVLVTIFDVFNGKTDLGSLIGNLFDGFVNFAKSIDLGKIATNAKQFISDVLGQIVKAIQDSPIGKTIGDAFAALSKIDLGKILSDLFGGGDKTGKKVNGLASLVNNAVADLTPGFSALKTFIDTYVTPVANGIAGGFSLLINTLTNNLTPEQSKGIADFVLGLSNTFTDIKTKLQPVLNGIDTVIVKPIQNFGEGISGFIKNIREINGKDIEGVLSLVLKIGAAVAGFVGSVAVGVVGGIIDGISKALPRIGEGIAQFVKSLNSLDKGDIGSFLKEFGNSIIQFGAAVLEIPLSIVDSVIKFFQELLGLKATGIRPALEEIGKGIADFVRGAIRQFDNLQRSFRKTIVGFRLVGAIISGDIKAQAELLAEDTAFAISDKFGKVFGDLNAGKINLTAALASLKLNINGTVVDLTKADPAQIAAALGIEQKEGLIGAVKQAISLSDTKALKFLLPIIAQPEFKGVEGVSATIAVAAKAALDDFRKEGDTTLLNLTLPALINLDPKDLSEADRASFKKIIEDKLAAAIASGDLAAIQTLLPLAPKFDVATDPAALKKQVTDAITAALAKGDSANLALALQLAPQFGIDPKTLKQNLLDAFAAAFKKGDTEAVKALIPLAPQFGLSTEDIQKQFKDVVAGLTTNQPTETVGKGQVVPGATGTGTAKANIDIAKLLGLDATTINASINEELKGLNIDKKTFMQSLIDLFTPKEGESFDAKLPLESINLKASDTEIDDFTKKLETSGVPAKIALAIRNKIRDAIKGKQATDANFSVADPSAISILDVVDLSGLKADITALPAETRQALAAFGIGVANDVFAGLAGADDTVVAQKATTIADTFMTAINEALGIKSPSTVMYDVGTYLIEGLNLGLTENAETINGFLYGLQASFYQLQIAALTASDSIYNSILLTTINAQPAYDIGVSQIMAFADAWLNLEIILLRIQAVVRDIAAVTGIFSAAFGVTPPALPPKPGGKPPKKAAGGSVQADKLYEVADGRYGSPELLRANGKSFLIPGRNGLIVPPSPASVSNYGGNSSASMTQSINIQISGAGDPVAVGAAVRNELAQINRENPISRRLGLAGRK